MSEEYDYYLVEVAKKNPTRKFISEFQKEKK